ncbi:MAG: cation acetate symporter, partial [Rhodoferax sp.]|nr:cation acetate symporter [Rhodoferax sp.]
RQALLNTLRQLQERRADDAAIIEVRRELAALPRDAVAARDVWTRAWIDSRDRARPLAGMPPHVHPFPPVADASGTLLQTPEASRLNFLALMFCLMVGTAGMPHLLTRFLTTSSVSETRRSVAWSLFFIALLYISVPALAALVKFAIMSEWVGRDFDALPIWIAQWAKVDPTLISASDVNGDRILQFSELRLGADIVMLATPELGGLPYVISGLVAAGGLAAALSTADGLLLTIGSAVAYDGFSTPRGQGQDAFKRVMLSKFVLLIVALLAAFVAAQRPGEILYLVSAAFSLAAAAFVPAMVFGIFWSRATGFAAVAGMLAGLVITMGYMVINASAVRGFFGWSGSGLWMGIQPVSAG